MIKEEYQTPEGLLGEGTTYVDPDKSLRESEEQSQPAGLFNETNKDPSLH